MNKVLIGLVSAVALMGLAACGEAEDGTTQSVDPATSEPTAPTEEPATDDTTTQGLEPDTGGGEQNQ